MSNMLIFGMGYAASRLAERLLARGWDVGGTTRDGRTGTIPFENKDLVLERLRSATHILSSVPPDGTFDPVLASYGEIGRASCRERVCPYVSISVVSGSLKKKKS